MSDLRRITRSGRVFGGDASGSAARQRAFPFGQEPQEATGFLALLESGMFADASIICGAYTIDIHKVVVIARSRFFKGALAGGFLEAETGCVVVEGFTIEQIRRTLHYIYGENFENEDNLSMADCVDLIKLGEYFLVDGMIDYSANLLWKRLKPILVNTTKSVQGPAAVYRLPTAAGGGFFNPYAGTKTPKETLHETGFDDTFKAAVESAYAPLAPPGNIAQRLIADFVWAARGVLVGNSTIEKLNKKFPEFGSQVFTVINKGPKSGFLPKWKAGQATGMGLSEEGPSCKSCTGCGRNWRWDRAPTCFDPMSLELRPSRAYCMGCMQREASADKKWMPWTPLE